MKTPVTFAVYKIFFVSIDTQLPSNPSLGFNSRTFIVDMVKAWLQKNMSKLRARPAVGFYNYFLKEVAHLAISPFKKVLPSRELTYPLKEVPTFGAEKISSHEKTPL